jgi:hypothetical protein
VREVFIPTPFWFLSEPLFAGFHLPLGPYPPPPPLPLIIVVAIADVHTHCPRLFGLWYPPFRYYPYPSTFFVPPAPCWV